MFLSMILRSIWAKEWTLSAQVTQGKPLRGWHLSWFWRIRRDSPKEGDKVGHSRQTERPVQRFLWTKRESCKGWAHGAGREGGGGGRKWGAKVGMAQMVRNLCVRTMAYTWPWNKRGAAEDGGKEGILPIIPPIFHEFPIPKENDFCLVLTMNSSQTFPPPYYNPMSSLLEPHWDWDRLAQVSTGPPALHTLLFTPYLHLSFHLLLPAQKEKIYFLLLLSELYILCFLIPGCCLYLNLTPWSIIPFISLLVAQQVPSFPKNPNSIPISLTTTPASLSFDSPSSLCEYPIPIHLIFIA